MMVKINSIIQWECNTIIKMVMEALQDTKEIMARLPIQIINQINHIYHQLEEDRYKDKKK